jgi:dolichyl-phosphate beta-glucosyltransferase
VAARTEPLHQLTPSAANAIAAREAAGLPQRFTPWTVPPLSLVVPLFNEESRLIESGEALGDFLGRFAPPSELILVDDGSADRTAEVAEGVAFRLPVTARVLRCPHRGKGAAVRAGLLAARAPVAAFCDIDLATPLDELERIIAVATSGPVLAIGSRDVVATRLVQPEGELRELMGKMFNRLLRLTLTPGIFDTQCGAKAATTAVWHEILPFCREDGFAWDAEAIAVARRLGVAVWEVGIEWRHDPRTRVRPIRDGAAMVRAVPRIARGVRLIPSLVEGPAAKPIDLTELEAALQLVGAGHRA